MSNFYSQKSYQDKLGTCKDTISQSGCFLTSYCNLLSLLGLGEIDPPTFNKKAFPSGGCLANASYWASLYNLNYTKTNINPEIICIMETNFYKSKGVPQHFCVIGKNGKIIDPLDKNPNWKANPYPIVSYRVFVKKNDMRGIDISHFQGKIDGIVGYVDLNISKVPLVYPNSQETPVSSIPEQTTNEPIITPQGFEIQPDGTPTTSLPEKPVEVKIKPPQIPLDARETHEPSLFEVIIDFLINLIKRK